MKSDTTNGRGAYYTLRRILNLAGNTRDCDRWTAEEWLRLYAAYRACDVDLPPCEWSDRQVREALRKRRPLIPQWDDAMNPIAGKPMRRGE